MFNLETFPKAGRTGPHNVLSGRGRFLRKMFCDLFGPNRHICFRVKFWDNGEQVLGPPGEQKFTIWFRTREALKNFFVDVSLGLGEGYTSGEIVIEGDINEVIRLGYLMLADNSFRLSSRTRSFLLNWQQRNTRNKDKQHIAHHYDIGNDFYKLWLDQQMVYSCAYFRHQGDSLDVAQQQKMKYCCHKLRLQPGDTVLDIGCGWGSFLILAAKEYGVSGTGITLSREQADYGAEKIREAGLADQISIEYLDYRELARLGRSYKKIVSIGMFEHVGKANVREFFQIASNMLKPKGMFLLHTIGKVVSQPTDSWMKKYIFPGSYIPGLPEVFQAAAEARLKFIDLENLRTHYGRTLDIWLARFENQKDNIEKMFDAPFIRMWRFYLAACAGSFWHGDMHLFQLLFSRESLNDLPLTRAWMTKW